MVYCAETLMLRDGGEYIIRSVEPEDAQRIKNRRALNLYMKYGFAVYGTRPHGMKYPDGDYADDYLMVKMLP